MSTEITAGMIVLFRAKFPAFDAVNYPDSLVETALYEADAETGGANWGVYDETDPRNFKQRGLFLYAAHWLTSYYPNGSTSMSGSVKNPVQSRSVGDESVTYQTGQLAQASVDVLWLSSTSFGQQWILLRKRAGMGARAV